MCLVWQIMVRRGRINPILMVNQRLKSRFRGKTVGIFYFTVAGIAQLGERQTEDLKVACSIHAHRISFFCVPIRNLPIWPFSSVDARFFLLPDIWGRRFHG